MNQQAYADGLESADSKPRTATIDGNEACADVAFRVNEICSIFPITPATSMAELADQWAGEGRMNVWGTVPDVVEMQSELGAAGTLHGGLQAGSLVTSFTSSQGLLLMIPNMFKVAGELLPCVIHVASRALSTNALTIFGDHQDVMAVRQTGFAMLASANVQEAHDFALITQAASLESRIPFLHFFDGFRTSHEIAKVTMLEDGHLRAMLDEELIFAHRARAMSPDRPNMRGTVQNPDVFFQTREAANPYFDRCPGIVQRTMDRFAELTGRRYKAYEYSGHPEAERVIVLMGSGAEAARETAEFLAEQGEKVGVVQVRLYRPFDVGAFIDAFPKTTKAVAVLDRTKEPGSLGEPLYLDVVAAFAERRSAASRPSITGGRFGIGGKEFHAGMVRAIFDELRKPVPKNHFTIGIYDDQGDTHLDFDENFAVEPDSTHAAIFYGLGADGTVGANKNTIKIIGDDPEFFVQAYFLYDSKKSGSQTVSHLRFGPTPIRSNYLIRSAKFIGCHVFGFLNKMDVLARAAHGATLLLNCQFGPDEVWSRLPRHVQAQMISKRITLYVIDATRVAKETGMRSHTNTVLQTCYFAISGLMPREQAIAKIKHSIQVTYGRKGKEVVQRNFDAVDQTLANLHRVVLPEKLDDPSRLPPIAWMDLDGAPDFIKNVTAKIIAGEGESLPTSALPVDGGFPSGSAKWEKRNVADTVPVWNAKDCIQCGNCSFVCPHSCIRTRLLHDSLLDNAPAGFESIAIDAKGFPETRYTLQIYMEDCTGCGLCVDACPVRTKEKASVRAINMVEKDGLEIDNRRHLAFFETLPVNDRSFVDFGTVRGVQFLYPTFEFSGACAGCGETPYLKLTSQLFGDRMIVANASGCSSVYGGSLPTTPWSVNHEGRGPAWATSLFEDNAEFGLGMRLSADRQMQLAHQILGKLSLELGEVLVDELIHSPQRLESDIRKQRARVTALKAKLTTLKGEKAIEARRLLSVADSLVRRSVWIIGGDGWAYDIGSSGVDHVLASGRDVNLMVLDNEVYANTGGQSSKATPLGAVAKFASAGKRSGKKDLALQAIAYGNVYVARIAMGANPQQTLTAIREAEAYPGPSLVIAYSHCIAHGINMEHGMEQQRLAVHSGYWPLIRYNPELVEVGDNPFILDSARPSVSLNAFCENELRYRALRYTQPEEAARLLEMAQQQVTRHWALYERMAQ
ncbi:MAG: pyruvate:ferredoxin (flavodoxin) oxidoreductase [Methanoregulaceae archaeon]|nr:pyruvate:ferredoxin (flavodoxin) oxidoreductase [Methanoregulaceae archaeon]